MGTPTNERAKAYRQRKREHGYKRLSCYLSANASDALAALQHQHPQRSLDELVSAILMGDIPLPGNSHPLPCHRPLSRAELAKMGHQWRAEGLSMVAIAERFNVEGWTPNQIPKQLGIKPRADSAALWTEKAVSQLLTRDYPVEG